jgi:acetyltransferase (GNAT) family protein
MTRTHGPGTAGVEVAVRPLTMEGWPDLQQLFAETPGTVGCQCAWFFRTTPAFREGYGSGNREFLRARLGPGPAPGLLAYVDGSPAAWCAFGPRESYGRLTRSRLFGGPGRPGTWAVVCFFVPSRYRGLRLMDRLIEAAVEGARAAGATGVEAYPVVVEPGRRTDSASGYHGFLRPFVRSGFRVVARPSEARAVVRLELARSRVSGPDAPPAGSGSRGSAPTSTGSRSTANRGRRRGSGRPGRRPTRERPAE